MKILVTGGRGMLGSAIKKVWGSHDLILTGHVELDIRNIRQVISYAAQNPELIIHAAAETDHVAAEFDPVNCYMTNYTGTQNMVELARTLDIPLVYISTCGIFDGSLNSYHEFDPPSPLNHYARSKYYGELAAGGYKRSYIIRSGWGMGGGPGIDKKFINKIFALINAGAKSIGAIADVFGSPTYAPDLAATIKSLIMNKARPGIWNIGGERASRFDVAAHFVDCLGLADQIKVYPVTFEQFHLQNPLSVNYTKCEVLNLDKLNTSGFNCMRPWKEALKEYSNLWKISKTR